MKITHKQDPLNLSVEEWIEFLKNPQIFDTHDLDMVLFVYFQPAHLSTATEIAPFTQNAPKDNIKDSRQAANRITAQNRKIAKKIFKKCNVLPPPNSKGGLRYWNVLFDGDIATPYNSKGQFVWILRPNLVTAISEILKTASMLDKQHFFEYQTESEEEYSFETTYPEGTAKIINVHAYERNPIARRKCIELNGCLCQICGFDFGAVYGKLAEGKIHIHHILPLAESNKTRDTNPVMDLIPVCPNCHYVIHMKSPAYTPEEIKNLLQHQSMSKIYATNSRGATMQYKHEDLQEAKRQIDSTLHKLRETIKTLEAKPIPDNYKSQLTLARRRIKAFELAVSLIENEIAK